MWHPVCDYIDKETDRIKREIEEDERMKTYNLIEVLEMFAEDKTLVFKKLNVERNYLKFAENTDTGYNVLCWCESIEQTKSIYPLRITDEYEKLELTLVQPKITLTDDEKVILRNVNSEYKWIAVDDKYGKEIYIYDSEPFEEGGIFKSTLAIELPFKHIFQSITFENSPHLIADLIK